MLWTLPIITAFAAHATALVPRAGVLARNETGLAPTGSVDVKVHDAFSSSIGVLGCKVDVNRIAYWPGTPDCSNMCIKLTSGSRSRTVLHIDTSGGSHDISFDTYQYLAFGTSGSASESPVYQVAKGYAPMDYEVVDMSECADIITSDTGKMSFIASSPNQVNDCLRQGNNWVVQNYELRNINDPQCQNGVDEVCTLDTATGNPKCPSQVGIQSELSPAQPVIDLTSPCGDEKIAGSAPKVPRDCGTVKIDPLP